MSFLKCKIYKGYHSHEAFHLIQQAWETEDLLLLAPPHVDSEELFHSIPLECRLYKEKPVFGLLSTGTVGQKLVLYSNDGTLVYRGRNTSGLNRGGEKFSLEAMENRIRAKLGIETVCVSLPHDRLGEELGILAESETKEAIFDLLQKDFGRSFEPKNFSFITKLPQNASCKVDRKQSLQILKSQLDA